MSRAFNALEPRYIHIQCVRLWYAYIWSVYLYVERVHWRCVCSRFFLRTRVWATWFVSVFSCVRFFFRLYECTTHITHNARRVVGCFTVCSSFDERVCLYPLNLDIHTISSMPAHFSTTHRIVRQSVSVYACVLNEGERKVSPENNNANGTSLSHWLCFLSLTLSSRFHYYVPSLLYTRHCRVGRRYSAVD